MHKAVAQLRQTADELEKGAGHLNPEMPSPKKAAPSRRCRNGQHLKKVRYGTVCGRYRNGSDQRVSDLRLCGLWLKGAGFDIGQKYEVEMEDGKLTIRAVEENPKRRNTVAGEGPKRRTGVVGEKRQGTQRPGAKARSKTSGAGGGVSRRD